MELPHQCRDGIVGLAYGQRNIVYTLFQKEKGIEFPGQRSKFENMVYGRKPIEHFHTNQGLVLLLVEGGRWM